LKALGAEAQIQSAVGVSRKYPAAGSVQNVVARVPAAGGRRDALLLVAHYDSVAVAPGAADDAAGVATVLETLRALRAGPPLKNDLILLFTDGEEAGLLGAEAFAQGHPWAKDVRVVLNFEARGSSGVAWMFETSGGNGQMIRDWTAAAPAPFGSSLTNEAYKHLPNDTDMTVFKMLGVHGLNFAFMDHWQSYHTSMDRLERLDPRSLQHQGSAALALARSFGNADLRRLDAPDVTYFTLPPGIAFSYSAGAALALTVVLTGGVFVFGAIALRRRQLTVLQTTGAVILVLFWVAAEVALAILFNLAVERLHSSVLPPGDLTRSGAYGYSFICLELAVAFAWLYGMRRWIPGVALGLAGAAAWLSLAWLTLVYAPGLGYVFAIPLVFAIVAIGVLNIRPRWRPGVRSLIAGALCAPAMFVLAPLVSLLWTAFGMSEPGPLIMAAVLALSVALLGPVIAVDRSVMARAAAIFGTVGLICFVWAAGNVRYSPQNPQPLTQVYLLDTDTQRASFASATDDVDMPWTRHYLGGAPSQKENPLLERAGLANASGGDAPLLTLEAPSAQVLSSELRQGDRFVTLRIRSGRGARTLIVLGDAAVREASIAGRSLAARAFEHRQWRITYTNVPTAGFDLRLHLLGSGAFTLHLLDQSEGLPRLPGGLPPLPSSDVVPFGRGDVTLVHASSRI